MTELPLTTGSTIRDGANTWTYHGNAQRHGRNVALSVGFRGPSLWLDPDGPLVQFNRIAYRFALLDRERRLILLPRDHYPIRLSLAAGTACPRLGLVITLDDLGEAGDILSNGAENLSLLILRPRHEGASFCRWTSPHPIDLRNSVSPHGGGLARDTKDLKPDDITRWITDNPGPDPAAPSSEIAGYLVSLLEQTNRCRNLDEDHPAIGRLAAYVPGHLDLFVRARESLEMDQHASRALLRNALQTGIERRQIPDLVARLPSRPNLVTIITRRGWAADIATDLARLIRGGNHDLQLLRAAASLPDAAGITHDEWLAIFRLLPATHNYETLRTIPDLEPALAAEVDALFASHFPIFSDTEVDSLIQLALLRGHPEAPARLQRAVRYAMDLDKNNAAWFVHTIRHGFDLSTLPNHHGDSDIIVPWFLDQDLSSFTFNPTTRLYTPSPIQNSKLKNR